MIAFSDRPERGVKLSRKAALAVDLEAAYAAGHLPGPGGWLDQDSYHVRLIKLARSAKARRAKVEERKRSRLAKLRRRR